MKKAKPEISLADQVHAWTFNDKHFGKRMPPQAQLVQQRLRAKLRIAQRFVIDDPALRLVETLALEVDRLEGWSFLARLPYEATWFEFNYHALDAMNGEVADIDKGGFLMFSDAIDGGATRWVCHCFGMEQKMRGGSCFIQTEPLAYLFDPEGDPRTPLRGSSYWDAPTVSLRHDFPKASLDGMDADPECLISADLSWLLPRIAVIVDPWWEAANQTHAIMDSFRKIVDGMASRKKRFCLLIAMLASLSGLPKEVKDHPPQSGKRTVGMHRLPFLGLSTVSITIPHENQIAYAAKALGEAANAERRRLRFHLVRGHWRVVERGTPILYLCRHLPKLEESGLAVCEKCGMLVRWIDAHGRGDASLGVVEHDYVVTC